MPAPRHPLGGPIRAAYRRAGMNRSQFMRALGVAYSTIINWEHGRTRPNANHLETISRITGASVQELLGGEPPSAARVPRYPALEEFLRTAAGRSASPAERKTLEGIVFHDVEPTVSTYHAFLLGLRFAESTDGNRRR